MSQAQLRRTKQRRFLAEHPDCYFCGGASPATEIDHVPPRACFPDGYAPEGFESPACKACNESTVKQDQIFGLYSMLMDFDGSKMWRAKDLDKMRRLRQGIANNYPDALPDEAAAFPVNRVGCIITPAPVAFSLPMTPAAKNAIEATCRKLTHALYFREAGKILTRHHQFLSAEYQPQREGTQDLNGLLMSLLPNLIVGGRPNIKKYGDRFRYIFGYKHEGDLFLYAAQFGHGITLWGIVCGPEIGRPSTGPLGSAAWLNGAYGAGTNAEATS